MQTKNISALTLFGKGLNIETISRRIKVYDLPEDVPGFMRKLTRIAAKVDCDKLIFYVKPATGEEAAVKNLAFQYEGKIEGFFRGEDTKIYAKYLNPARNKPDQGNVITRVQKRNAISQRRKESLSDDYTIKWAEEVDSEEMAELYNSVFSKYPTPIHDPSYIVKLMRSNVYFSLIYEGDLLVSACSADVLPKYDAAEFTDCATLPSQRGKRLLSYQFSRLEERMKKLGIRTMFSYTRATSMGMNIINAQQGFTYGGCMIQNSYIGTGLEDMNIWYKSL
ncbi:putative beta-lysine N-acetyltransferase [Halobacillus andaensis]|uniref:Beta-lysine N-acetyltransferase n=1 Tax=Halobacillus andaensis TaxID=1176239 RepID=A0A917B7I2_HALAA|nr:putative beta-lysine N-acetyltransferase [Halobacillus andaensis]MBP2006498.1 putative beta-lysine N-acetyltransferase [Halobacillus andaensis]GGF27819.1 putative beta-lysine N-acetyltransferase [Halobacillus andaensis]